MDADLKTLRLSKPVVTAAALEGFVRYQQALVALAGSLPLSEAHTQAHAASGLDVLDLEAVRVLCADFCGRRWTARELKARRERAQQAGQTERVARIDAELPRLEELAPLEQRYGEAAVALLREKEDELLSLHEQAARLQAGFPG